MSRLRVLGIAHAAAAAAADVRSRRTEQLLLHATAQLAELRGEQATTRTELATTRTELAAVREDLVWAFASAPPDAGRPAPARAAVVDLHEGSARTA